MTRKEFKSLRFGCSQKRPAAVLYFQDGLPIGSHDSNNMHDLYESIHLCVKPITDWNAWIIQFFQDESDLRKRIEEENRRTIRDLGLEPS